MDTISIREHQYIKITKDNSDESSLTEKQASILKQQEITLPKGVLTWGHNKVKFSQFCGVIQIGNTSIEVLPKIYGYESESNISRRILIKMLFTTQRIISMSSGQASINLQKHHLLDIFISHFCDILFNQVHQGLIRLYQKKSCNLSVVRGKINMRQNIKQNSAHKEMIFCDYDELETDNKYNQVIKVTLELLYSSAKSMRLKQRINELICIFSDVSTTIISPDTVKNLPMNRMVSRYEPVFHMCEWFLSGLSPDIYTGNIRTISLLFDMNKLFESFVAQELKSVTHSFSFRLKEQGPQKYLAKELENDKNVFLMKPDISLLDNNGKPIVLLDAKWKLLNSQDRKHGVSQSDMYQMLAYANQYACNDVVLVYPKHSGVSETTEGFKTIVGGVRIHVWTIDLAGLAGIGDSVKIQLHEKLQLIIDSSND